MDRFVHFLYSFIVPALLGAMIGRVITLSDQLKDAVNGEKFAYKSHYYACVCENLGEIREFIKEENNNE